MNPPRTRFIYGISAALVVCAIIGLWIHASAARRVASDYLASALKEANISETVTVGGAPYSVTDGIVSPASSEAIRFRVLRTTYALMLARRSPILGIAGVDPSSLMRSVDSLSAARIALANRQKIPDAKNAVRTSLYPIGFISDLASLEKKRLLFIGSGSDSDEISYERALQKAAMDGGAEALQFQTALVGAIGTSTLRFPTLGGTITQDTLFGSATAIRTRFSEIDSQIRERNRCLSGYPAYCHVADIQLAAPAQTANIASTTSIASKTYTGIIPVIEMNIALASSTCFAEVPSPYLFSVGSTTGFGRMPIWYGGNSYFAPTQHSYGATMAYLHNKLDIDYSLVNPMAFYICPDVLQDISDVYAVRRTVQFAQTHAQYAPLQRKALLSERIYTQSIAIDYLSAVVAEIETQKKSESGPQLSALEEVLNIWTERSSGLDMLVSTIAAVDGTDVNLHANNVPFNIDARTLFLTHSAFPSLFLAQNRSAGRTTISLRTHSRADQAALAPNMIPLNVLNKTVSQSKIFHDINAFLIFEGIRKQ